MKIHICINTLSTPYAQRISLEKENQITRFYFNRFGSYQKPHPKPLLEAIRLMNSEIENTIMVGNSSDDILAANRANIKSVACKWSVESKEDWTNILALNPSYVVENPRELIEIIAA